MACLREKPQYNPMEGERLHHKAMQSGSAALLARLMAEHPAIIDRLTRKQTQEEQA